MNSIKVHSGIDLPTVLRATPSLCNKCACMVHSSGFLQSSYGFFSHLILAVVTDHFGPKSTQSPLWRKTVCGGRRKTHDMVVPLINVVSSIHGRHKLSRFHIGFPDLPGCLRCPSMHFQQQPTYLQSTQLMVGTDPPSLKKLRQTSKLWLNPCYQNIEPFGSKRAKHI